VDIHEKEWLGLQLYRYLIPSMLALATVVAAQSISRNLAIVNGETITEEDVGRVANGRVRQLTETREPSQSDVSFEREKLAIRWDALNYLIERKLTRAEAARQMISEDDLIENEIDRNAPLPTREVVMAFIEANRVRMPLIERLSPAEAFSQVRGYLNLQTSRAVRAAYFDKLSKQYDVKTYMEPLRTEVVTAGHPARGTADAQATIVEFSDFDCPQCGALTETLQTIQKVNSEKLRLVYRQFPLAHLHAHAQKAAEASLCAHDQNRFWEFHDALFANQKELDTDALKKRATSLGLDTASFNSCIDSGTRIRAVDKEIDEGYSAGVITAPTLFINGRMFVGNRPAAELQAILDDEFKRIKN